MPFASVLFAPSPSSAALSLLTLGALTFEARRAALGTIDWLDDPEREHATEVWKALVVFGGFQGAQLLTQQLALAFGNSVSPILMQLAAYALAALGLWLMTSREQETSAPAQRLKLAPVGLLAGALSAAGAWLYLRLAPPALDDAARLSANSGVEAAILALAVVGVAPLVESFFSRLLQPRCSAPWRPRYLARSYRPGLRVRAPRPLLRAGVGARPAERLLDAALAFALGLHRGARRAQCLRAVPR